MTVKELLEDLQSSIHGKLTCDNNYDDDEFFQSKLWLVDQMLQKLIRS